MLTMCFRVEIQHPETVQSIKESVFREIVVLTKGPK